MGASARLRASPLPAGRRVRDASQARGAGGPPGPSRVAKCSATIESTCQPSENVAAYLGLAHPAWTRRARLPIAEAQHEVAAARPDDGAQAALEAGAVGVREDVEQARVEGDVEDPAQGGQIERIGDKEGGADSSLCGLLARPGDRRGRRVHTGDVEPQGGQVQRVLARAATQVDHGARNRSSLGEARERGLGPPDVPWRLTVPVCPLEAHDGTIPRTVRPPHEPAGGADPLRPPRRWRPPSPRPKW